MRLVEGARFSECPIVAIAGAGGKTTALFRLGIELPGPVFITTTTHLGVDQAALADQHLIIPVGADIPFNSGRFEEKITLFTGPVSADGRLPGISAWALEQLRDESLERHIPLLIEADGARGLPLKAPGLHEPCIPGWVSDVIIVAGMQGVGKLNNENVVHRPERLLAITGVQKDELISTQAVSKLFLHQDGGLKNIPAQARRIALLNQADTDDLQSQAGRIAGELTDKYHVALVGSLANRGDSEISACFKPVAGVILAAGAAERFGSPKPLLEWQGEPFIRRIANTAIESGLNPVIVVTGYAAESVQSAVTGLPVEVVYNPDWQSGQASSIISSLKRLPEQTGAAIFFVADQPQVTTTFLAAEIERHRITQADIVAPLIDGKRANPVLFDQATFKMLGSITGDAGGRQIFSRFKVNWLDWSDTRMLLDVDTPQDYQRLLDEK